MSVSDTLKSFENLILSLDEYVAEEGKTANYKNLECLDIVLYKYFVGLCSVTASAKGISQVTNTLASNARLCHFGNSLSSNDRPGRSDNLSSSTEELCMYRVMSPHHSIDRNEIMISDLGFPSEGSPRLLPLYNPTQDLHHVSAPYYVNLSDTNSIFAPVSAHQQAYVDFPPTMSDSFGVGSPPHHQMNLNDSRPPPSQTIHNTDIPAIMLIEQSNTRYLSLDEQASELQADAIHYDASSENGPDSQQRPYPSLDQ